MTQALRKTLPLFLKVTLPALLLAIVIARAEAGLAVDQYIEEELAYYGDLCNYYAYVAFRVPILEIIAQTMGDYEEQNVRIYKYESFNLTFPNKTSILYTYVPPEYQALICNSRTKPLMCKKDNETSDDGEGTCACLEMSVTEEEEGKTITHTIRTIKSKASATGTGLEPQSTEATANTTNEGASTTTSPVTPTATTAASKSEGSESDTATDTTDMDERLTEEEALDEKRRSTIQCLAEPGTFCGTPFVSCKPYRISGGKKSTACVFSICRAAELVSSFLVVLVALVSFHTVSCYCS